MTAKRDNFELNPHFYSLLTLENRQRSQVQGKFRVEVQQVNA